ncbi:extracellular solute-binding protein [Streptomyces sp. NBC_00080]|uniref:extracellular solute-binding protein n=1 Tax=Streptomyces sp. NBC_00080 TaxID=2975645 RepID=UPI0032476E26
MEDSKALTTLLRGFTKETHVKVKVQAIPWANVNDKLTTAVASGKGPDVVQVGLSQLPSFVAADALADLTPYAKDHPALQDSQYLDAVASNKLHPDGKRLTMPWISDVRVLFYRSDILGKAGITKPPTTWSELHADAAKLAGRGQGKYGFYIPQWDSALPAELTWQAGGDITDAAGKVTFDSPQFKKAADYYLSFYKDKLVPTASDFDQTQGLVSGATPMLISGPYLSATINSQAPELAGKWEVAPLPADRAGTSLFGGSNLGVWRNSSHIKDSLRLLDYMARPATQVAWYKATNDLPAAKAALDDPALAQDPKAQVYVRQLKDARLLPLAPQWDKISQSLLDSLNSVALKGADKSSALAGLDKAVAQAQQ